jgi:uncharacterized protein (DUF1697 family)
MKDLRALFESLGMRDVQTVVQSGNIVFTPMRKPPAQLERRLERAAAAELGLETDFFVRTADEWDAIVGANPFTGEAKDDPARLILMTLRDAPSRSAHSALNDAIVGRERARVIGRNAYLVYPDGTGRSKLTIARIEKALGTRGTARNWNTVRKLAGLVARDTSD